MAKINPSPQSDPSIKCGRDKIDFYNEIQSALGPSIASWVNECSDFSADAEGVITAALTYREKSQMLTDVFIMNPNTQEITFQQCRGKLKDCYSSPTFPQSIDWQWDRSKVVQAANIIRAKQR